MSEKIQAYRKLQNNQRDAVAWASKLGQPYSGGGGGVGALTSCQLSAENLKTPTIYHQYSDGAANYHQCPGAFLHYLNQSIHNHFEIILEDALILLAADLKAAGEAALEENTQILKEIGLLDAKVDR